MLLPAEYEDLQEELPFPEGGRPGQYDWYVALELASDLGVDIFRLEGLPMEQPYLDFAKCWAMMRREAIGLARDISRAAQEQQQALQSQMRQ